MLSSVAIVKVPKKTPFLHQHFGTFAEKIWYLLCLTLNLQQIVKDRILPRDSLLSHIQHYTLALKNALISNAKP